MSVQFPKWCVAHPSPRAFPSLEAYMHMLHCTCTLKYMYIVLHTYTSNHPHPHTHTHTLDTMSPLRSKTTSLKPGMLRDSVLSAYSEGSSTSDEDKRRSSSAERYQHSPEHARDHMVRKNIPTPTPIPPQLQCYIGFLQWKLKYIYVHIPAVYKHTCMCTLMKRIAFYCDCCFRGVFAENITAKC